jgi:lantibiotic modifying enzyme
MKRKIQFKIEEIAKLINHSKDLKYSGIVSGNSGLALFLFYFSSYSKNNEIYNKANNLIEDCFEKVQNGEVYQNFAGGLAGLGWLIEHLSQKNFIHANTNEVIGELDDFLYSYMIEELNQGNFDYLHNASGIGLYFLNRIVNPKSNQYLTKYIELLYEQKEIEGNTIKWKFKNLHKDNKRVEQYNLSLSHGMASIVAILSKIYDKGINKSKTYELLIGAINYLILKQFDIKSSISYFPNSVSLDGYKGISSRLAWCYGDLGIGVALWNASKALNDDELEQKSLEILLHSTKRRDLAANYVMDAGLCHGTAGIAHIFNRMYINTKILEFKEAADYWFMETLKMAKFEDGLAGFKAWHTQEYGGWTNDFGLLEGIAGIGLAMLSYVTEIEPAWDECLLLS